MTNTFKRGFKEKHLIILLNFCKMTKSNPRIEYTAFHKKYHPYTRRQSTADLINSAYKQRVIIGPVLYANTGIDVKLIKKLDDPIGHLIKCTKDPETTLAYALQGDWSFIQFRYGASTLKYADLILPHSYPNSIKYRARLKIHRF